MPGAVAVLSDVHGVLPVLGAVLAEPDVRAADLVVVTGDLASGPQPNAVLDRLLAEGDRLRLVRGNADRELVALRRGQDIDLPDDVTPWAAEQLTDDHVELLAGLPHPLVLDVAGFGPVVFCHGSPRRDDELVLVDSPLSRWADAFADLDAGQRTVVCGHTHMPFVRLVDRRLVVNAGSIGMPYGRAGGSWALLHDGAVSLRHTPIDVDAAVAAVAAGSTYPDRQAWADEYVRAANSDADAIAAFTPAQRPAVNSERFLPGTRADEAGGAVVVVDVLRAFTTAAYAFAGGASAIWLVDSVDEALTMKAARPQVLAMGEDGGRRIAGFDFANSPWELSQADVRGRELVQRTSAGTHGVVAASGAERRWCASLVCATATARAVTAAGLGEPTYVITGQRSAEQRGEDDLLTAQLIERVRVGEPAEAEATAHAVATGREAQVTLALGAGHVDPRDIELAVHVDAFDFAMEARRVGDGLRLTAH